MKVYTKTGLKTAEALNFKCITCGALNGTTSYTMKAPSSKKKMKEANDATDDSTGAKASEEIFLRNDLKESLAYSGVFLMQTKSKARLDQVRSCVVILSSGRSASAHFAHPSVVRIQSGDRIRRGFT